MATTARNALQKRAFTSSHAANSGLAERSFERRVACLFLVQPATVFFLHLFGRLGDEAGIVQLARNLLDLATNGY